MKDFILYIKRPICTKPVKINWSDYFTTFFFLFLYTAPLLILNYGVRKALSISSKDIDLNLISTIVIALVCAPIAEEILFRLLLRPLLKNIIAFTILIWVLALLYFREERYSLMHMFLIAGIIFLLLLSFKKNILFFQKIIKSHFAVVFYLSCFLFGLIHLINFSYIDYRFILAAPILIAPNILGGLFLGFVRMRYGIIFSILFHSMINLIALPGLISGQ